MQRTFGGAPATVGQTYAWTGNKNVGAGSMTVTELQPSSKVGLNLDFLKPFEAHNTATFMLTPQGDGTLVTWTMQGPTPYMFKIMHLFMNVDKMVGKDFEAGLAKMKAAAERG
jgi:hypothetical protein